MPSGSDIRVPPRALSAAKQGRAERPGAAGAPVGAEEVHSLPTHQVKKTIEIEESPTRGNRVGALCRSQHKLRREPTADRRCRP